VQVPTKIACPLYVCVGKYAVGSGDDEEVTVTPYCVVVYNVVLCADTEGIPNRFVVVSIETELAIDKAVTLAI
jgi:hypothetical protein